MISYKGKLNKFNKYILRWKHLGNWTPVGVTKVSKKNIWGGRGVACKYCDHWDKIYCAMTWLHREIAVFVLKSLLWDIMYANCIYSINDHVSFYQKNNSSENIFFWERKSAYILVRLMFYHFWKLQIDMSR